MPRLAHFLNLVFIVTIYNLCVVADLKIKGNHLNMTQPAQKVSCDLNLTDDADITSLFSPPVNSLQVTLVMLKNGSSRQYPKPRVFITWKLPELSESVTGFLVYISSSEMRSCYLFNLNESTRARLSEHTEFEYKSILNPNNYTVRVHSVAGAPPIVHGSFYVVPCSMIVVKPRIKEYKRSPAVWITDIVIHNDSCAHSVSVSFELAPIDFNFSAYKVILEQKNSGLQPISQKLQPIEQKLFVTYGQRQGSMDFRNVSVGDYSIMIAPENTDWSDNSRCRCQCRGLKLDFCLHGSCPEFGCMGLISNVFSIESVNKSSCSIQVITVSDPVSLTKVLVIAISSVAAVVVVLLLVSQLLRPKDIDLSHLPPKTVLLLYTADQSHHVQVVHHLISFLERHCNCLVATMHRDRHFISQNSFYYTERIRAKSDKILLVNSEDLAQNFIDEHYIPSDPIDTHVKEFLMEFRQSRVGELEKLIIARFDYTKTDIPEILHYRQHEFLLMKEIEMLILHIHGYERKRGRYAYHLKNFNEKHFQSVEVQAVSLINSQEWLTMNRDMSMYDIASSQEFEHSSENSGERQPVLTSDTDLQLVDFTSSSQRQIYQWKDPLSLECDTDYL